jgi:hypothetical protein
MSIYCTGWGGQLWTKIVFFFSLYRPSCLTEAYGGPEKYWLVFVVLLANYLFNINFIFPSDSISAAAELATGPADVFRR